MKLENKVISIIKENIESKKEINLNTNLQNDLGLDSFEMLMIANGLEDEFKITIDESEYAKIVTVQNILDIAKNKNIDWHEDE